MLFRAQTGGVCPLCGVAHVACGQATAGEPVDIPTGEGATSVATSKYRVTINGQTRLLKLSDEDAKVYSDAELVTEIASDEPSEKTRPAPTNKARRASGDKSGG